MMKPPAAVRGSHSTLILEGDQPGWRVIEAPTDGSEPMCIRSPWLDLQQAVAVRDQLLKMQPETGA
jgi:hypothetical protein